MPAAPEHLAAAPVFAGLAPDQLERLARCAADAEVAPGERLFRMLDRADRVYVIREGTVALEVVVPGHGVRVVDTLHAGDVLGLSWLVTPDRWHFDGRAVDHVALTRIDGDLLRAACVADPVLGHEVMRGIAATAVERLQAARLRTLDLYAPPRR